MGGVVCTNKTQTNVSNDKDKVKAGGVKNKGTSLEFDMTQRELYLQFKRMKEFPTQILNNINIDTLQMDFNQITSIPPEIGKLTNLEEFSISRNKLTSLPNELRLLTSLRSLNTSLNPIVSFDNSFLPALHQLIQLHLGSNMVTSLPNLEGLTQLRQLGLSENQLGPFFEAHPDYNFPTTLQTLNLAQNQITVCPRLPNLIASITFLDLCDNKLTELPPSLVEMPNIRRLFLGGNHLSSLPAGFGKGWEQLTCLSMPFNDFKILPSELHKLTQLKTLDVRGNGFEFDDAPNSIVHMLRMLNKDEDYSAITEVVLSIDYEDEIPDEILPNLYLGCLLCARNRFSLQKLGITHILTIAEFKPYHPEIFSYRTINIEDEASVDIFTHFEESVKFLEDAISSGGKVLVHCRAGISRSATMVAAYVMKHKKIPRDESIDFVRERRPRIFPNPGFYTQLGKWQSILETQ